MSGTNGHRRYSLRLPKSKSCGRMNDTELDEEVKRTSNGNAKGKSSTIEHISRAMRSLRAGAGAAPNGDNCCEKGKKSK